MEIPGQAGDDERKQITLTVMTGNINRHARLDRASKKTELCL